MLDGAPLAALARPRRLPRPPVADPPAAQRAHAEGPDLRPDRARWSPPPRRRCPRRRGGERNWDYRYTWIRDATFTLWGLYTLGFDWEANDFFYFVADVRRGRERRAADHVRHRRRARPRPSRRSTTSPATRTRGRCAIGNGAYDQDQHDVWGARPRLRLPAHEVARPPARADLADAREAGRGRASSNWREPDRGIWEVRGEPQHFTSSKMMCWVAADRGARLAELREELTSARPAGSRSADEIHADICAQRARRARRVHPALRHRRPRRVGAADAARALPARRRRADPRAPCWRSPTS